MLLLLLENVEHLLRIHLGKARVEQAIDLPILAGYGNYALVGVALDNHQVNDIVASRIRQLGVLLPQLAPDEQVTERFVEVLVEDNERQLFVVQLLDELAPILLIPPVGAGSREVIDYLRLAQHEHP